MSEILEAVEEAMRKDIWDGDPDNLPPTMRREAELALEAAMPHIRAQIAEQIRGLEWTRAEVSEYMQDGVSTDYIAGRSGAISNAARIAERSGE